MTTPTNPAPKSEVPRKLHTYVGTCVHYSPKPGGIYECDKGVCIREHVGGPDFGWMAHMPCVTAGLSKKQVPCELRELPTPERVKADQAEMERQMRAIVNGACPRRRMTEKSEVEQVDLDAIEKLAKSATPSTDCGPFARGWPNLSESGDYGSIDPCKANFEFIAAANPSTVQALIAEAREGRRLKSAIVFDVRTTYQRRSFALSDDAVFQKWLDGVKERGWKEGSDV